MFLDKTFASQQNLFNALAVQVQFPNMAKKQGYSRERTRELCRWLLSLLPACMYSLSHSSILICIWCKDQGRSQYEANRGTCLGHFFRFPSHFFSFNTLNTKEENLTMEIASVIILTMDVTSVIIFFWLRP